VQAAQDRLCRYFLAFRLEHLSSGVSASGVPEEIVAAGTTLGMVASC
jgi:hypothetical protein